MCRLRSSAHQYARQISLHLTSNIYYRFLALPVGSASPPRAGRPGERRAWFSGRRAVWFSGRLHAAGQQPFGFVGGEDVLGVRTVDNALLFVRRRRGLPCHRVLHGRGRRRGRHRPKTTERSQPEQLSWACADARNNHQGLRLITARALGVR